LLVLPVIRLPCLRRTIGAAGDVVDEREAAGTVVAELTLHGALRLGIIGRRLEEGIPARMGWQ
jgi:hypothetical protein